MIATGILGGGIKFWNRGSDAGLPLGEKVTMFNNRNNDISDFQNNINGTFLTFKLLIFLTPGDLLFLRELILEWISTAEMQVSVGGGSRQSSENYEEQS